MNAAEKLKNIGVSKVTALLITQHLTTYSVDSELCVVKIDSVIKMTYNAALKCTVSQMTTPEGVVVFVGGEAGAEGTIIIFNSSAMKKVAEDKFEKEEAAAQPKPAAQPKAAAKAAPAPEEDNKLALAIGKGLLYGAGAVAVGVGGWFAWKKWGSGSSV